ncbi:hypothetical protein FAZ19_11825 [Sphingobacterium alkalisoli]|uniref:Uncharacterized protein n=1 Tax=Sphingobacterium alkalisoli TaxID=1874115 RepID=A0A4U0H2E2_9SPHI|nr:hypothetical protein [Sphingobacterium alkalisoli]TJY65801.1 hypothetical protein FAZ19_11825 [Sphingobacterium alkalisoli]GGH18234.1 hypothetical protein GCM10011418_21730 [Sphingobacterium alkalisoli]
MNNIFTHKGILSGNDSAAFAFFSANVHHVLGISAFDEQVDLFHKANSFADQQAGDAHPFLLADLPFNAEWQMLTPGIIATFHFGHYRLLPLLLALSHIPICIMVSQTVKEKQQAYYQNILDEERCANVGFIVAEDPRLFFQIRSYLGKGYHILCYVDGGKGLGKTELQTHAMSMDFLHCTLWIRTGFAHIAYLSDVPIYAAWECMDRNNNREFKPTIYRPLANDSRINFVYRCVHALYADFARSLRSRPFAWENLFYLQDSIRLSADKIYLPDTDRYVPFRQEDHYFILDKSNYLSYPLNLDKFDRLCNIFCQQITI